MKQSDNNDEYFTDYNYFVFFNTTIISEIIAITSVNIPIINTPDAPCQCIILNKAPKIVSAVPKRNKTNGIEYCFFINYLIFEDQIISI